MQDKSRITMLGTGNAAVTKCYNTCFTIHNGNKLLLVDGGGGNGILIQLEKAGVEINDIHDIFITHAHTDHILGIIWIVRTIAQRMQQGKYLGELNVYSHDKAISVLDWICRNTLPKKIVARIGNGINFNVLSENDKFSAAGMEIQCFDICSTKESKLPVNHVFSATSSTSIFVLQNEAYDDTRRSCRNYYVLQGTQSNL